MRKFDEKQFYTEIKNCWSRIMFEILGNSDFHKGIPIIYFFFFADVLYDGSMDIKNLSFYKEGIKA